MTDDKGEAFHVDLTRQEDPVLYSGEEFSALGYLWDVEDVPPQAGTPPPREEGSGQEEAGPLPPEDAGPDRPDA